MTLKINQVYILNFKIENKLLPICINFKKNQRIKLNTIIQFLICFYYQENQEKVKKVYILNLDKINQNIIIVVYQFYEKKSTILNVTLKYKIKKAQSPNNNIQMIKIVIKLNKNTNHFNKKFSIIESDLQHSKIYNFNYKLLQKTMSYYEGQSILENLNLAQISSLMNKIEDTTSTMSNTFQQSILKHQQQFIKAYKIKIYELTGLFHQLKKNIEDKFINNAINQQLQTIMKQRDYFKYECLKLNTQYNNVLQDYKNLTEQVVNVTQQMNIYKHLLENEKLKSSEIEKNAKKLKKNLNELSSKTVQQVQMMHQSKSPQRFLQDDKQQINKLKRQIKQKSETIRALKAKIDGFEEFQDNKFLQKEQKKQLQEVFRSCVQSWKRQVISKSRKFSSPKFSSSNILSSMNSKSRISLNSCTIDQFSSLQKKQLLQMLFTHPMFLQFIEKLLFDSNFEVHFKDISESMENKKQEILIRNRNKLYQTMKKKGLVSSIANHPLKYR